MKDHISPLLSKHGLNLFAVFNLDELPEGIQSSIAQTCDGHQPPFKQIFMFGHGGKTIWKALQQSSFIHQNHPMDTFSKHTVSQYFKSELPGHHYQFIYPHDKPTVALRELGQFSGWHHPSPFRVGINTMFGTWFAYRAVVLADTNLPTTKKLNSPSPCDSCKNKPCIPTCPADALTCGDLSLNTCLDYRLKESSKCQSTCLSRLACPVAKEHRYSQEQIKYHYDTSLDVIKSYQAR